MQRVLVVLLLLVLAPMTVAKAQEPAVVREVAIPSWDGAVLAADLYWPSDASGPLPAVLMTHGWAGSKADLVDEARWLAGEGHVVLAYDSRGFGASEGTVGLNGPDERADASHLVTWLAGLQEEGGPQVLLDDAAEDDPRIGMYGYSYGGAIQLLAAAEDARFDALVPDITWNHLEGSLAPNGVVKRGWVDLLFWGGLLGAHGVRDGDPNTGGMDERLQEWYFEALQTGRFPAEAGPALAERSPVGTLANLTAPVLLTQGWYDTLFVPDEAVRSRAALAAREDGTVHLLIHPGGHGHTLDRAAKEHVRAEVARFLGRHLGDERAEVPAVQWYDPQARGWMVAEDWPPAGSAWRTTAVSGGAGDVTLAQAPPPSSHTETQQAEGTLGPTHQDPPLPTHARFPLDLQGPVALLGAPVVRLNVTPSMDDLTLFFSLVAVGLQGDERVVGNQVQPWRVAGSDGQTVALEVPLVAVAHTVPAGHRLELRVATGDTGYLGAREPGTVVVDADGLFVALPEVDRASLGPDAEPVEEAPPAARGASAVTPLLGLLAIFLVAGAMCRRAPPQR